MPYAELQNEQEEKNKAALGKFKEAATTGSGGVAIGAGGMPTPPGGGAAPSAATQAAGSGRFVNFDRIFAANQPQAQAMAGGVAEDVAGKAQAAESGLASAQQSFGSAVKAGTNVYGGQQVSQGTDTTQNTKSGGLQSQPQKGGGDGTQKGPVLSRDEAAAKAAQSYSGPNAFNEAQGYAEADKARQEANDNLALTKDAYGLQTYFQNKYQQPGAAGGQPYTEGMSVWDAALTGAAGANQFAGLRQKYGNLDRKFADAAAAGNAAAADAKFQSGDAQAQYGAAVDQYDAGQAASQKATQEAQKKVGDQVRQGYGEEAYQQWVADGMPTDFDAWRKGWEQSHVKVSG